MYFGWCLDTCTLLASRNDAYIQVKHVKYLQLHAIGGCRHDINWTSQWQWVYSIVILSVLNKSMAMSLFYCHLISTSISLLKTKKSSLFQIRFHVSICCGSVILAKLPQKCPSLTVHNYDEVVSFLSPKPRNWFQPSAYSTWIYVQHLQSPLQTNYSQQSSQSYWSHIVLTGWQLQPPRTTVKNWCSVLKKRFVCTVKIDGKSALENRRIFWTLSWQAIKKLPSNPQNHGVLNQGQ